MYNQITNKEIEILKALAGADAVFAGEEINPDNLAEAVVIEPGSDWVEDGGWYYYNSVLSAGDVTEPLFSEVVFYGPSMTNEYQNF